MNCPAQNITVTFNSQKLMVYRNGDVWRLLKNGDYRFVENRANCAYGYNRINCNNKMVKRHRIIAYAYLNLDIENTTLQIDHIDGDRINNHVDNLRIVSNQENQHNQTKAKGYYWDKHANKWRTQIKLNKKTIYIGYFDNENDAHNAYLQAKKIYHKSCPINLIVS